MLTNIPYFDAHCDTITACKNKGSNLFENKGHIDIKRLKNFKKAVQFFAMYYDPEELYAEDVFLECKKQKDVFLYEINKNKEYIEQCFNKSDIEKAHEKGKIAAVLTCEGAELIDCDIDNLNWAKEVGIKSINITWNYANKLSGTHKDDKDRGLNDYSKEFIKIAQDNNILIDVSHCSDKAFFDLVNITRKPIIASHSNSRIICDNTRNLTDDMFKEIINTNGVAGINLYSIFINGKSEASMEDIIKHIDHFMELGGSKNIGLGADLDGCETLSGGIKGVQDMDILWDALIKHGFSENEVEDIFYNNFLRVFSTV